MRHDLARLILDSHHLKLVQKLLKEYVPKAEVWAYGSRVVGGAQECSDLDLVLREPSALSEDVEGWMELQEALTESTLPVIVEVHLWSRLPQSFHKNIEAGYVVLQKPHRI
jgi:predicted nucleotidyltransferase